MKRKIICFIMLFICIASSSFSTDAKSIDVHYDNIKILVNGQEVKADVSPFIYAGRTFLPIRPVAEALGAEVLWNAETKTVEIYDYRIAELQDLAYGLYMIESAESLTENIGDSLNDLINHRNDLVADCWNNIDVIYEDRINDLNGTKEHLTWQIENYIPKLCEYPHIKAVNTDDIKNAFYYCQMAIKNIDLAYDELDKYDSKKDNSIILQNYAVYSDKAGTYYTDAHDIFLDCGNKILDVIYSY